ncbi:MAG: helix-turn-helix transcriptional regulator [Ruminococcaceae bacterium]|nr:helix-turn-helix transcriptional regulator [Oscillospiraceae bacterium]
MDAKKFGAFVADIRKENGMTQADLAEKIHVTDKAVSRWERGLGFPDINTIEPLAEALGITMHELMKQEKNEAETITKEEANEAVENAISMAEIQRKKLIKRVFRWVSVPVVIIVALMIFHMVITGFMKRTDVFMLDYSVTEHTGVVTMHVGVASSIGYVRSMENVSDDPTVVELEFYSAFGGLNSSLGAQNVYTIQPGAQCSKIYFRGYDGWRLVLEKNTSGEWIKAE